MDFIQLTKVAEDQQIIYARAICEEPDRSGQVADYVASKAAFQKWASETQAASMGKSMGNIRVMHKPDVAGRVIDIQYDDVNKAIDVAIQVDRPDVWKMCKVGAYTGLSVGGSYGRKWADTQFPGMERYEPRLSELSIVDRPCVPSATFQLLKRDGQVEERHFANVAFDADIIGTLKSMVSEHNEAHPNEWSRAKLGDLKKVFNRGRLDCLAKSDDGNPLSDGLGRVQQFLSVLSAETQESDDKDLLSKSHPVIVSGGGVLRKKSPQTIDPNTTGNKVGAATAAAITGASIGYAGRAAGKVMAVPIIPAMKTMPRFRHAINSADDVMTAAKRGIKNTARTGSFRAGAKTAVRTFKAIQNGTIKSKGILGITRSYRGAASVPAAVIGTSLAGLSFAHSYKSRRNAQRQNADIHNALVAQMGKLEKGLIPGADLFHAGALAISTGAGAIAGGIAAYKGNPYRDKDGKFTDKSKAAFVVGLGATAGAAAGFGGGLAITHRGMQQAYSKAQAVAEQQVANYAQSRAVLLGRGNNHYKLAEAVKNVRDQAKDQFDALSDTHSDPELRAKYNPYKSMAEDSTLGSANPNQAKYLTDQGQPNSAGKREVISKTKALIAEHESLKRAVLKTQKELGDVARGVPGTVKDAQMREAGDLHDTTTKALEDFESKLAPHVERAEAAFEKAKISASKERTKLTQRMAEGLNYGVSGVSRDWADLYKESARLREQGIADKDAPYIIKQFRSNHEKAFQAEHARILMLSAKRAKELGRPDPTGTGRFQRVIDRSESRLATARNRAESLKNAKESLLGAKIAVQMHRMTSRMTDVSRPMMNEANAAIRIARHALTPNSTLQEAYTGAKRKTVNAVKRGFFTLDGKPEELKDAAGKVYGHNIKIKKMPTLMGEIPELSIPKVMVAGGGLALVGGITYRNDKGQVRMMNPKNIRVNPHIENGADSFHGSLTIQNRNNPQKHLYLGGINVRNNRIEFLRPGRTAFPSDWDSRGQQNNQQQGGRPFTAIAGQPEDFKALNAWRNLSGQNKSLVVEKSMYGTQYRNHNIKQLSPEQQTVANNAQNVMRQAVFRLVDVSKDNGKVKQDMFWPLVRKITGADPVQIGSEGYPASALTARDQANAFKRMYPQSVGLNAENPFSPESQKATADALLNVIKRPLSENGIANMNDASNATAMKGVVHAFKAAQFIAPADENRLIAAVEAKSNTAARPGYRNTTGTQDPQYVPSNDKDYEETINRISDKHPEASKVMIANRLNTYLGRSKRDNPDLDAHDHLNEAYANTVSQLDSLYGPS